MAEKYQILLVGFVVVSVRGGLVLWFKWNDILFCYIYALTVIIFLRLCAFVQKLLWNEVALVTYFYIFQKELFNGLKIFFSQNNKILLVFEGCIFFSVIVVNFIFTNTQTLNFFLNKKLSNIVISFMMMILADAILSTIYNLHRTSIM